MNLSMGPEQFKVFVKLPYLGDISYKVSSSMKSCLNQIKCGRLNLIFSHDFTRLENMFKFKDRQPKHLQNGVVYKITCSCGKMYIGETGRCLKNKNQRAYENQWHQYNRGGATSRRQTLPAQCLLKMFRY